MKVLIVESSYPGDFYKRELDGVSVAGLLNTIRVKNELRFVLDAKHLKHAIEECARREFDVLHVSSHGDENGIALANNKGPTWDEFAGAFQQAPKAPKVLVMSSCCGASSGIGEAFASAEKRPGIILGSTKELSFSHYATAWAILYHNFRTKGVGRDSAQVALKQISAVVHKSFVYRRWDEGEAAYKVFPGHGVRYEVRKSG